MVDIKIIISAVLTLLTILLVTPLISPFWKQLIFVVFALYTLPLFNLRKQFRGMVYDTDSWTINFKPVFLNEVKTLFTNEGLDDSEIEIANKYRIYLLIYLIQLLVLTFF